MDLAFTGAMSSTVYHHIQASRPTAAGFIPRSRSVHLRKRSRPSAGHAAKEGTPLMIGGKLESDRKPSIRSGRRNDRPSRGEDQRSLSLSGDAESEEAEEEEEEEEEEEGDYYGLNDEISANGARANGAPALIVGPNDPHLANHLSDACLCLARELAPDIDLDAYMARMQGFDSSASPSSSSSSSSSGIVVPFLADKTIFITGATGFLAKVLVEKILRVQPDVKHLYLLIKAKDERGAKRRLREEILGSALFSFLRCRHGDAYAAFMERKVSAVVGDIGRDGLGIDPPALARLADELDIVVNSAATTTFDERYDYALNLNTKGPRRIMEFARSCPRLQLVMHVSTAFVNGTRKGLQREEAFEPGHSIANESLGRSEGDLHQPDIDVDLESDVIAEKMSYLKEAGSSLEKLPSCISLGDHQKEKILTLAMKELGMERANNFGWQDTYVFTKAMGEMVVDSMRGHLPTVIIRPSVVESSFREPFPGWMEGNRMMDPIIISYGKGQLPGFLVDPNSVLDVVPVDMVANAMLAAMVEHARKPGLEVYQVASSVVNPLVFSNLARLSEEHFKEDPFLDSTGKPIETFKLQLYQNMDGFMDALSQVDSEFKEKFKSTACNPKFMKRYQQLAVKVKEQATYLANLYHPYTFYAGRFDTSKTQRLFANLSDDEKQLFGFDVSDIDWETYIKRIHIPGLRKHVLKGRGSNM